MPATGIVPNRRYITAYDPATALHLATYLADDGEEIVKKIKRASNAQKTWRYSTFQKRRVVVRSLMNWLLDNQDAAARVACRDTGKTSQ